MNIYIYVHIRIYIYMYVYIYIFTFFMYVRMYVCIYVCVCVLAPFALSYIQTYSHLCILAFLLYRCPLSTTTHCIHIAYILVHIDGL